MEQLATDADVIADYRETITPDLYAASDLVDWVSIDRQLESISPGVEALQNLAQSGAISSNAVAAALRAEPQILDVVKRLFAVRERVVFDDGRELPTSLPVDAAALSAVAELLLDLHLPQLLTSTADIRQMTATALIAAEAPRRRFRARRKLQDRIVTAIESALTATRGTGLEIEVVPSSRWAAPTALRAVDYVVRIEGASRGAIASTFQARSGGRQQRDLTLVYPALQERLRNDGLQLILLADGAGLGEMPSHVLAELFQRVFACMTLRQAEDGALADAFRRLATARLTKSAPLDEIISAGLEAGNAVLAAQLPAAGDEGRLALATYVNNHPELSLELAHDGSSLQWRRWTAVRVAVGLARAFSADGAMTAVAEVLSVTHREAVQDSEVMDLNRDVFMSRRILVSAGLTATVDEIRTTALRALGEVPESRFALYVAAEAGASDLDAIRRLQYQLALNVVVVDLQTLVLMAKGADDPYSTLLRTVVAASDLAKISPFVLSSVAPARVYYGREVEEATVTTTIHTNSVAILGGRRIGKTSLMKHVIGSITTAGLAPFFGDCQTVRTWSDFARMAERAWHVQLQVPFAPDHLFELVEMLRKRSGGKRVVLLLDEVDQLLDWDQRESPSSVPEAFFRACRGISQEGIAQFVFSGERTIATKLWDAQSPHWNFCRSLPLRQLDRAAAERLLEEPLKELEVLIRDRERFHDDAWLRTTGHPQLLQFIGDKLVLLLNERPADERYVISPSDLATVTNAYEFVEQYLETYWGQAKALERMVSLLVRGEATVPAAILQSVRASGVSILAEEVTAALRVLDLYGIVERDASGYRLKASWFPSALDAYGGVQTLVDVLRREVA